MQLTIRRPDDWHVHLRDGAALATTVAATARQFRRAIVMPNLLPPVTTTDAARRYRQRILAALPTDTSFEPLMTLYLTDNTRSEEIVQAAESGLVHAIKLYPAGATTNSAAGVTRIENTFGALESMSEHGLPLLVHGEVTDVEVDVFDREAVFIERVLAPLVERFQGLKVVLEHITTGEAVDFVMQAPPRVAATVTAHHLLHDRNALFRGGLRPHLYCLPVLKRARHRQALLRAVASGSPRLFLGSDSAPHPETAKQAACGCAGVYSAPCALEAYVTAFESVGALDKLEDFAACHGPAFYDLPLNEGRITLQRDGYTVPDRMRLGDTHVVPLCAGETLPWRLASGTPV
jgi:dihydroorotase